jgi:hypothetical protein
MSKLAKSILRLHASSVDARYLNPRLTLLTIISPLDFLGVSANPSC